MRPDPSLRSSAGLVAGDSWPSLFFLWFCWLLAAILGLKLDGLVQGAAIFGIVWLGHISAAVLSGRQRWLSYGSAAVAVAILTAVLIAFLGETPYPLPYAAFSAFRWGHFGVVLVAGVAAAVALRPPASHAQLTRAGIVVPLALSYFFLPESWVWWHHPSTRSYFIALTLTLAAVGTADTIVTSASSTKEGTRLVETFAVPFATLGVLVLAAGLFWRLAMGGRESFDYLGPTPEPDHSLAIGTLAGTLVAWFILSAVGIRRIWRSI